MSRFESLNNQDLLEHLLTVNRRLAEMQDLDELLTFAIDEVLQLVGAEWGYVILVNKDGDLDFRTQRKISNSEIDLQSRGASHHDPISHSILNKVIQSGQSLVVEDALFDPRFQGSSSVQNMRLRSIMCVPLITQNRVIGAIYVENRTEEGRFSESDLAPIEFFNHHVAVTIENANIVANLELIVAERTQAHLQAKHEAEAANQAKSAFLTNMNHELRSPLHAILGFTKLAQHHPHLPSELQEYLSIVHRSSDHLLGLINQVLDMAKVEAGRMTLNKQTFDLGSLLDDINNMFKLKVQDKNLSLAINLAKDLPHFIRTDEMKLKQVLINLISNAVKFTQSGGITVDVAQKNTIPPRIAFTVTDTGGGVAPDQLNQIFDAFVQADAGVQSKEGTGLGLPISRSFIQFLGGELQIESQLEQGTIVNFDILLEVGEEGDAIAHTSKISQRIIGTESHETPYRILVTDDQELARHLLAQLLKPLEFEVREAENGLEAVNIWKTWKPHLIWMDMHMPILNGLDASRQIKNAVDGDDTVIIALTASAFEEERTTILKSGCDDYLRKPFNESDIFALMQKHLGIEYIYEQVESHNTQNNKPLVIDEELATLPEQLLDDLEHAATLLDETLVNNVLSRIRNQNVNLANVLLNLSEQFKYSEIVSHIQNLRS